MPATYGSVQVSLDTAFGDGRGWWDGGHWQPIPEDARIAAKEFQRAVVAAKRSRDGTTTRTLAGALYQLGNAEARRGRETQAAAAYQEILKRFADDLDLALRGYAAAAAVARGNLLARKASRQRSGDRQRTLRLALAEYRAVIDRYARDVSPGMHVWVAEALVESSLVYASDAINGQASAVVNCDAALRRLDRHTGPIADRLTAVAAENAAACRRHLGLPAEPATTVSPPLSPESYGGVQISLDAWSAEGRLWWTGAEWLALPGDARVATKELQKVITAAGQPAAGPADVALAGALYETGNAQSRIGRESQARSAYDDILRRFAANPDPALQGYVAAAMFGKGQLLAIKVARTKPQKRLSVTRQALAEFRAVIDRYAGDPNPGFKVWVAAAMLESGKLFGADAVNDTAMAVVYSDTGSHVLRTHTAVVAARVAAAAGLNAGLFLEQLGLTADAITVTRETVARFGDALDPTITGYVATARTHIATWEGPARPMRSPTAATSSRAATTALAGAMGLLVAVVIAFVAVPALLRAVNNTTHGSPGSLSGGGLNLGGGSTDSAGAGSLGITGTKPAWISLSYTCECPPTNTKSSMPDSFHGELCPPTAFKFGFDKAGGYDTVSGGCSTSSDWSVCAVAGSPSGTIPPCAVDSSQTRDFAELIVGATNDVGGAPLTGTGRPLDLVIYYCGSGDSLEGYPTFPSVECVGG